MAKVRRYGFFLFGFVLVHARVAAQTPPPEKHVHSREQLWLGYFNQTRFSNRWGMWVDVHYRQTDNFINRPFQLLVQTGVNLLHQRQRAGKRRLCARGTFPGQGNEHYTHRTPPMAASVVESKVFGS